MKNSKRLLAAFSAAVMMLTMTVGCTEQPVEEPVAPTEDPALREVRESLIVDDEIEGLAELTAMEVYVNSDRITGDAVDFEKDVKKLYYTGDTMRAVNYVDGYILDLPVDWKPDYSLSLRSRYDTDELSLIITREDYGIEYFHGNVQNYLADTYKVLKDPVFHENNDITLIEDVVTTTVGSFTVETYRLKLEGCKEGTKCYYTYVDYYNTLGNTFHMMFKCVDDRKIDEVISSLQMIDQQGTADDNWTYEQGNNPNWNEETTAFYEALCEQEHVDWGLFSYKLQTTGWKINIPLFEKKIDYTFPVISEYAHYGYLPAIGSEVEPTAFPLEFCEQVRDDGRMMQVSYQYTVNNNGALNYFSPSLEIYRGTEESVEIMTQFAEGAAAYGEPFYFRLNNEMNTDWTSYCAIANMLDPDIFQETWIALYDIFTQTGANEYAMWIFNGFDTSYPPYRWCDYRCYMPPAEYVDLIGLTGYNMGSYGNWSSFETLYDGICEKAGYNEYFSDWPWIISEFGCAERSHGSKVDWVTGMFDCFEENRYPNIKVAIWFNANDYNGAVVTNELVIDKDPAIIEAFKDGLARTQP